ncbi:hypothetical protein CTA1_8031 [Colletotrichum tanaceti]|uniref:Uncharacterized protein n=1 Tax=Colletotrichum tanaceti TaxID=1306861 RepID=A0A4U6XMN0_9PEZI|nr:hypothetical protein CTA1_8031 [Colletotrichum tanaceti]
MDQCRNTADKPSSMTSVTTALPFWKSKPPTAGRRAKARGIEAQFEISSVDDVDGISPGLGLRKSLASLKLYSDKVELLLLPSPVSANEFSVGMWLKGGRRRIWEVSSTTTVRLKWPDSTGEAVVPGDDMVCFLLVLLVVVTGEIGLRELFSSDMADRLSGFGSKAFLY